MVDRTPPELARLAPGPCEVTRSRRPPGQPGVLLETHRYQPGERGDVSLDWHLMVLLRSAANRGVRTERHGDSISFANKRGTVTILPAGFGHAIRLATPCDVTVYAFAPRHLISLTDEIDGPPARLEYISATQDGGLRDLLNLLDREVEAGGPSGQLYADGLALTLLARALALSAPRTPTVRFDAPPLNHQAQQRLLAFIEDNLHRNLRLEELAAQVGYSRGHFLKIFRTATGSSPHQYLLQRRIEHAKVLLNRRELSLNEIAICCGFSSQSHFTTEFRRRVGTSPARYRRSR